jgi:hypothetical protein
MRRRRRIMKSNAGFVRWMRAALLALPALSFLAGCGGSGVNVAGGGTGGTGISAGVITGFGSVIVNDVEFFLDNAAITLNDNTASEGSLRLGMFAKIKGTFLPGGTGVADLLDAENEVLGEISSKSTSSFIVLGQEIFVDNETFFDNNTIFPPDLSGLMPGDIVEVYGIRETSGIRATRVEIKSPGEGQFSVKGTVSNFSGDTFNIGALRVTVPSETPLPVGFDNGVFVDVKGIPAGPDSITATIIELENEENVLFNPQEGDRVEEEGFVSDFTGHPGEFMVGMRRVRTTAFTRFEGGGSGDLADGVRVEAEGRIDANGVLVAEEIEFE